LENSCFDIREPIFHSTFEERSTVGQYRVVAKDEASVVTVSFDPLYGGQIQHKHFDGQHYWISLGRFREYFKRLPKNTRKRARKQRRSLS